MDDALRASYEFCRDVSRREAKNFYWSFRLLAAERRRSMCALYAFMRHSDDLADEPGEPSAKRQALIGWRSELDHLLTGKPVAWPSARALSDTVARHAIPAAHLHEAIDGVAMDVEPRPFDTFDELYAYCYRVASAVGLCCIHIWGFRSEGGKAEAMAEACGVALQLTNILRDLREDYANGRVYLPREDLDRFGVSPEAFLSERMTREVRDLVAFEAARAYDYYERAAPLAGLVSREGRPVLRAIVGIYRGILDQIRTRDYDVLSRRASLPGWKKAAIAARALVIP